MFWLHEGAAKNELCPTKGCEIISFLETCAQKRSQMRVMETKSKCVNSEKIIKGRFPKYYVLKIREMQET